MVSLGCPKNLVDSEIMLGHLAGEGVAVRDPAKARVVIVNTCGFIEAAKAESVEAILEQVERKKRGEIERVVVAGCMVQKYGAELRKEIPEIDAFVGLDELERAPRAALGLLPAREARRAVKPQATRLYDDASPRLLTTGRSHAYLKIAEGCDNPCSFCTIPQMRGAFRSRTIESLVREGRLIEEKGVRELILIAQDTTRYGEDLGLGRRGLARLVEALLAGTGFRWIRFLYAYPKTLDRSVLDLMGRESRFVSYVDMPLQSVSRPVLAGMKRGGGYDNFRRILDDVQLRVPDVALRTTFLVGFPGEGEAEFDETVRFVREIEFDHLGAFAYSPEPGSGSEPLGDPVPPEEKERRRDLLLSIQQGISRKKNRERIGRTFDALIEGPSGETDLLLEGRMAGQAPGIDGRLLVNDVSPRVELAPPGFARVRITAAHEYDLVGRVVGAL
jgi:ribosomal protein S12 methylthiotransferase